jgi:hypothetical protein
LVPAVSSPKSLFAASEVNWRWSSARAIRLRNSPSWPVKPALCIVSVIQTANAW